MKRANATLATRGLPPLPDELAPHSLRKTFASTFYAIGETPPVVIMAEMGHTSPNLALRVYPQAIRHDADERDALAALIAGKRPVKAQRATSRRPSEPQGRPCER